jgi:hypothetical protein
MEAQTHRPGSATGAATITTSSRWQHSTPAERWSILLAAVALSVLALLLALALAGCDEDCVSCLETVPPAVPTGVYSVTGDHQVTVYWSYLEYPDRRYLVEYRVWRDDDADGEFDFLGAVPVEEPYDDLSYRFVDTDVTNGHDYEYAVSSVNEAGVESELSYETVIDTPRPEGSGLELHDVAVHSTLSGFDFSALGPEGRMDPLVLGTTADVYVAFAAGIPYLNAARDQVKLQDYGTFLEEIYDEDGQLVDTVVRLDWVDWAPGEGYSQTGMAELIYGHAYVIEIREPATGDLHYAKLAVTGISATSGLVVVDWAYQGVPGLPELSVPAGRREDQGVALDFQPIRF